MVKVIGETADHILQYRQEDGTADEPIFVVEWTEDDDEDGDRDKFDEEAEEKAPVKTSI